MVDGARIIAATLQQGIALFQQGRPAEAEVLLNQLRERHPQDFNVLHVLGIMLAQGRDPARGVALIGQALALRPDFAPAWNNLGNGHRSLGQTAEALAAYDRAIALQPGFVEAHNNRGNVLALLGRMEEALAEFDRAVSLDPRLAEAHGNRAVLLVALDRPEEALKAADTALTLRPGLAEAHLARANAFLALERLAEALAGYDRAMACGHCQAVLYNNRGNALLQLGRLAEALDNFDMAIRLQPDYAEAFNNRGRVVQLLSGAQAALESYDRAIVLAPGYAAAHSNRGNALMLLGRPVEALASHDAAIAAEAENFRAHNNRGNALLDLKRVEEALENYQQAVALRPDYAEAHWNRGVALLLQGRMEEGWAEYRFRHRCAGALAEAYPPETLWTGAQDLKGKTLLLHREQGMGDTIQFCRYALVARDRGARVLLAPHRGMERLLASLGQDIGIVSGEAVDFDYHVPLLDMPGACGTRRETIPCPGPYLSAEPERIAHWREWLGDEGFKLGIAWQGNPLAPSDVGRSFPVWLFGVIARIPGMRLIALQKGAGLEQLDDLPAGMAVERPPAPFDDGSDAFADTAALMASLDLVITSDTAVAHLAGALGRPVMVALKHVPDWRWMLDGDRTPWYPGMRLIRQRSHGDWSGVFAEIEAHLRSINVQRNLMR